MKEQEWDKKLNINTIGRDASIEDNYHFPYEPTPYCVLERLVESGYINKKNQIVDYGSGKGRVPLFLNYKLECRAIGVDFSQKFCNMALKNKETSKIKDVDFYCINAEKYELSEEDSFYFFHPFSLEILQSVVGKIKNSYYNNPREMKLFFYYPSDAYISYLMMVDEMCFLDEIDCQDLFEGKNNREKILIFQMR